MALVIGHISSSDVATTIDSSSIFGPSGNGSSGFELDGDVGDQDGDVGEYDGLVGL